jgi:hypothetical protein
MSRKSTSMYVEDTVGLLVEHFGVGRVRAALAKVSHGSVEAFGVQPRRQGNKPDQHVNPSFPTILEQLRHVDSEKHRLIADFYMRLKEKAVLPESQDIRYYAQLVGIKDIAGKSRKDMIPKLMRFLLERPSDRLRADIERAANISEQQRKQGFSVLTDKILAGTGKGTEARDGVRNELRHQGHV